MQTRESSVEKIEIIFTADEIAAAIDRMAREIARDYADKSLLLIAILKGAMFVVTDLARALSRDRARPALHARFHGRLELRKQHAQLG